MLVSVCCYSRVDGAIAVRTLKVQGSPKFISGSILRGATWDFKTIGLCAPMVLLLSLAVCDSARAIRSAQQPRVISPAPQRAENESGASVPAPISYYLNQPHSAIYIINYSSALFSIKQAGDYSAVW
jgi:hypothetical protein